MSNPTDSSQTNSGMYGTRPRKPVIALLLSVCPGLGHHYAGHLKRGILLYVSLIIASWLCAIAFMSISSKLGLTFLFAPFIGGVLIAVDAYLCARRQPKDYRLEWYNKVWIYSAVFLTLLFTVNPLMDFLIGQRVVRAFLMTSNSMTPTILERDIVLVNKLAFPKRGEIALIKFGSSKPGGKLTQLIDDQLIKRIIAIPGDTLEIHEDVVRINGQIVDEPYANYHGVLHFSIAHLLDFGPKVIPPGYYFVMGDNRNESLDSRILGYVRKDQIEGTVTKTFWSWNFDEGTIRWDRTGMSLK